MARRPVMYLVRGPDGTMHTIVASSAEEAAGAYARKHRTKPGDYIEVKARGAGNWMSFCMREAR